MAINFMDLLGALTQSGMSPSSIGRMQSAGGGIQDLLGNLMGGGQSMLNRAGQAVGGKDNLAAAGLGALLGALSGKPNSSMGGLGGGLMGLLGMMAFKALKGAGQPAQPPTFGGAVQSGAAQQAMESDAELILTAMIDAAKADGQVDQNELKRITGRLQSTGIGQEGMNYIISRLQAPMSTDRLVTAARGRPELAAQIYSASLMAIEVDTAAERNYLTRLAGAMGLSADVARNIEQLVGMQGA